MFGNSFNQIVMTTEEKAKAYDKALNWMRELYPGLHGATKEDAEHYFPELRESEDERIRKCLADCLSLFGEDSDFFAKHNLTKVQVLAYLKKQKDRMKPIYDARESFESALEKAWNDYHNGYENVDKLEDDYVECAHAKGFREGFLYGLEKQKKQRESRPTLDNPDIGGEWSKDLKDEIHSWLGHLDGKYTPYSIEDIKLTAHHFAEWQKQKEQKEQQQFISCDSIGAAILSALASGIDTDDILKARGFTYEDVEKYLISVEQKEQKPSIFPPGLGEVHWNPIPSAKKELVEKPADEQFPPLEGLDAIKAKYYDDGFKNGFDEGVESVKSAEWSEEDEKMVDNILAELRSHVNYSYLSVIPSGTGFVTYKYQKEIDWLKSLRPQPKKGLHPGSIRKVDNPMKWMEEDEKEREQKPITWSDEDEDYVNAIIAIINRETALYPKGGATEELNNDLIAWLKRLRPSWKPREEQMEALLWCVAHLGGADRRVLAELYEHLKMYCK